MVHIWDLPNYMTLEVKKIKSSFLKSALNYTVHLCLEVHCIRYELRLFMAKAFPLLKLIMTSTCWGAVSTILKVFGMTQTRTWNLPIQIQVCYYWAKSAGSEIFRLRIVLEICLIEHLILLELIVSINYSDFSCFEYIWKVRKTGKKDHFRLTLSII